MSDTYRVFSRKPYMRVNGGYAPNPYARKITIRRGVSIDEARTMCEDGPANIARDAGKEYRNKSFYEFERE